VTYGDAFAKIFYAFSEDKSNILLPLRKDSEARRTAGHRVDPYYKQYIMTTGNKDGIPR